MPCTSCAVDALKFEVKLEGQTNLAALQLVIDHLERREIHVVQRKNNLQLDEKGAREFVDFCRDLLDVEHVAFRINHQNWQPISEMDHVFATEWIDQVIKNEQVVCYYQPIVTADASIYAFEMLARFHHHDGSMIYPNEVFPAAKARGRLYALDRVCRMTAVKYAAALNGQKAFINFIPTSIYSPEFCLRSTIALSEQLGVNPDSLVFEVVETEQVEDILHLKNILSYYQARGFDYALDDVGEGYSTIELLADLKPKYMKLDMQFVQGVATDEKKQEIAKKFLFKAKEIGSIPLAEGIEIHADFEWLKDLGYQLFQGYYFGKPAATPLNAVEKQPTS